MEQETQLEVSAEVQVETPAEPVSEANTCTPEELEQLFKEHYIRMNTPQVPYRRTESKRGRNAECTCGSGIKFKKCCGR